MKWRRKTHPLKEGCRSKEMLWKMSCIELARKLLFTSAEHENRTLEGGKKWKTN